MPVLVLAVTKDLDELLQDGGLAALATLGEACGIVVVAINLPIVLIIAVLCSKYRRAQGAGEVIDVVLAFQRRDVGPAECASALVAEKA